MYRRWKYFEVSVFWWQMLSCLPVPRGTVLFVYFNLFGHISNRFEDYRTISQSKLVYFYLILMNNNRWTIIFANWFQIIDLIENLVVVKFNTSHIIIKITSWSNFIKTENREISKSIQHTFTHLLYPLFYTRENVLLCMYLYTWSIVYFCFFLL